MSAAAPASSPSSDPAPAAMGLGPRIRSALFEITACDPGQSTRMVLWTLCALFGVTLLWASFARLDIVAVAEGRLVPETYVKVVQPAESGVVREILVQEGQNVIKGDVLLRLDPTVASADHRSAVSQLALKRLELRRIEAQLTGLTLRSNPSDDPVLFAQVRSDGAARERAHRDQIAQEEATRERAVGELAAARETLSKLERTQGSYEQSAEAYEKLAKDKLVGSLDADEKRRNAVEHAQDLKSQAASVASLESSLRAQQNRLLQLESEYRSSFNQERIQLLNEANQLEEEVRKQGYREGLLELRAPQDGIVKELATTTIGAVVQPGTVLLTLVPKEEPLLAEVYIRNEDVGFVREGQPVRIKLSAYPFTRYGMLEGSVTTLSADASRANGQPTQDNANSDQRAKADTLQSPFKAIVSLQRQTLDVSEMHLPIVAGMHVQAEIREGSRTVLEYLLSPVRQVASEAGGER